MKQIEKENTLGFLMRARKAIGSNKQVPIKKIMIVPG